MDLEIEHPVAVYACDIDGCLAAAGHAAYDLQRLHALAELNRASRDDPSVPALTFVTGRPHAYVDAMMQALDVHVPVSFENGAGLATRDPYRAWLVPQAAFERERLARANHLLGARDDVFVQPGKLASLSVFPRNDEGLDELATRLQALLAEHDLPLLVDPSSDCVNLLLPGVDKALGLAALCELLGVTEAAVAGIGDSQGDVGWLRRCGVSLAPAAAVPDVLAAVTHVSRDDDVTAALAGYRALVRANRALLGRHPG
jgi:hydroxymethylpyrimidine pyrophosphatase-like HAD family hydrolase